MCSLTEQGSIRNTPNKLDEMQGDGQDQNVKKIVEKQEERDVGNTELDRAQCEDVSERGVSGRQTGKSVETQMRRLEEMLQEVHMNNEGTDMGPSQRTRLETCTQSDISLELAEENQDQHKTNPKMSIYVGEETAPNRSPDIQPTNPTSLAIGEQSAATQSVMLQEQNQTKLWRMFSSNNSCVQDNPTKGTDGELKAVKVSELKKRFEA